MRVAFETYCDVLVGSPATSKKYLLAQSCVDCASLVVTGLHVLKKLRDNKAPAPQIKAGKSHELN
jgi:hypothetical protein